MAKTDVMADETKDQRIVVLMSASELRAIDDWSFDHRIRSRGEAIRRLCRIALGADRVPSKLPEKGAR